MRTSIIKVGAVGDSRYTVSNECATHFNVHEDNLTLAIGCLVDGIVSGVVPSKTDVTITIKFN